MDLATSQKKVETKNQEPDRPRDSEVLVRVENVSKIFCRDFKKSLLYGFKDSARDLLSWGKKPGYGRSEIGDSIQSSNSQLPSSGGETAAQSTKSQAQITKAEARPLREEEFYAVNDVSFELRRGECLGLIGRNGAGKTTLLKMLNGLIKPDAGRIEIRGRVGALIALGAGFNPLLSGRENIYVNGSVLGLSRVEIDAKVDEIIDFAEIHDFIDAPVQNYSSGMQVRLGFAVATAMNPDVLILDEVLAVGDKSFRDKCYMRMGSLLSKCTVILVSHDESAIKRISDQVALLKHGKLSFYGSPHLAFEVYNSKINLNNKSKTEIRRDSKIAYVNAKADTESRRDNSLSSRVKININIELTLDSDMHIDGLLALGNICTNTDQLVIQFDFTRHLDDLKSGVNRRNFEIEDIRLAKSEYSLSLIVFDKQGKDLLFAIRDFHRFEEKENISYGSPVIAATNNSERQ